MKVREANAADIDSIVRLGDDPASASWPRSTYQAMLAPSSGRKVLVADDSEEQVNGPAEPSPSSGSETSAIAGFLVAQCSIEEWEIENIVVASGARRQGTGELLIAALKHAAEAARVSSIHLEVRKSNTAARALYRKCGFVETGQRAEYYSSPVEDAALLTWRP